MSLHVTHKWADVDELELATSEARSLLDGLYGLDHVEEAAILTTCNRVEVYLASTNPEVTRRAVRSFLEGYGPDGMAETVRMLADRDSIEHLFRVACGVESMVLGEDQILGQVKDARAWASEQGTIGETLDDVFTKAIEVGKRARTETEINQGSVSIGSAAVDLAEELLGELDGRTVMVVGAGDTATLVAKALSRHDLDAIFVANRTHERAIELADALGGKAIRFDDLDEHVSRADVLISATAAPHVILDEAELAEMRSGVDGRLLVVDIAQPRDVDPDAAELAGVDLHDLDSLKEIRQEGLEQREREVAHVEELVEEAIDSLAMRFAHKDVDDLIADLYREALKVREEELAKAFEKADFDAESQRVVEDLTEALVNRLLARPTETLKEASEVGEESVIEAAERIHGLDDE